jgi:hypothetical protein
MSWRSQDVLIIGALGLAGFWVYKTFYATDKTQIREAQAARDDTKVYPSTLNPGADVYQVKNNLTKKTTTYVVTQQDYSALSPFQRDLLKTGVSMPVVEKFSGKDIRNYAAWAVFPIPKMGIELFKKASSLWT